MKRIYFTSLFLATIFFSCNTAETPPATETAGTEVETETTTENESAEAVNTEEGVFFVNLKDGDIVTSPVLVQMGVNGMEVVPAGEILEGKGHHHVIIDGSFIPEGDVVPADEKNIHYGKGQTEDNIEIESGTHTLTLQFANGVHQSYGEAWSKTITVTVQ